MRCEPYLQFQGRCDEAFAFYGAAIGAKVEQLIRFRDMPGGPPDAADAVMHAVVRIGDNIVMASDGDRNGKPAFQGVSLSLSADSDAEAERLYAALVEGGQPTMPLMTTPFASRFGMLVDRFGVSWMVVAAPQGA